jgi:ribosomal protein L11 methyltransferase
VSERIWHAVDALVSPGAREAAEYGLMEAGATGTETRESDDQVCVTGYFERFIDLRVARAELMDSLRIYDLAADVLIELKYREVADRDWLLEWKKHWQPVEIGRFIIAPPWISSAPPAGETGPSAMARAFAGERLLIQINPGMAFGTGTHETTRLCLKLIEHHYRGGSFLDVGTGTGILAIAAAKMFPGGRVEACDIDAQAIGIAKENAESNGVADQIIFRDGTVDEQTPAADLVCANLTAPLIVELLPALLGATCGRLVLSGILYEQAESVQTRLQELGVTTTEIDRDGEWISLAV